MGLSIGLLAGAILGADPSVGTLERFERTQIRMGVPVTITVYSPTEEAANRAISAAFDRIRELNDLLSDYDADSELMRLCRTSGPGKPVAVSPELFFVLTRAEALSKESGGAFDVTTGPLVQLWRMARRSKRLPDDALLRAARERVGWRHVLLDRDRGAVELGRSEMRLDLGGIAKGYAADQALLTLKHHGISRALVAAAGDIVVGDPPPTKTAWRIGVGPSDNPDAPPQTFLALANAAVSTSGDAYQFVEIGGTRYAHIVDPATGLGMTRHSSVTVIAREGITADSLATAACLLGIDRGLRLVVDTPGAEATFVERDGDTTRTAATRKWTTYLASGKSVTTGRFLTDEGRRGPSVPCGGLPFFQNPQSVENRARSIHW